MQSLVDKFYDKGAIENEEAFNALTIHLTSISHFEDEAARDKVVKHANGFKNLLNHYQSEEWITEEAYDSLMLQANLLIEKWQS
ncbi:FIMAH domain-containing protein [Lentibacillus populi]|uniref:FIMAH domain-containing protein n=1 Tax=Lentibacillus populi TaxID=1827502 RepID=UPI003531120F